MNELKNLTNVTMGKLGKLLHKQNCSQDFFYIINYSIVIVQVRCITIETKLPVLDITDFFCFNCNVSYTKSLAIARACLLVLFVKKRV
jgi:hypothetical protein